MQIRKDFLSAEHVLYRLINYAETFHEYNIKDWLHLKNNEDYTIVYSFTNTEKKPLEEIYVTGRDIAIHMSSQLVAFNNSKQYPTLTSYIDSFQDGWINEINILQEISNKAKETTAALKVCPWAVTQMIKLFDQQIILLEEIKRCILSLKQSDTYKWENGQIQANFPNPEYETILHHINTQINYFSKVPQTFCTFGEEALRDQILTGLAPFIPGSVTGESYNKKGKTDILIQGQNSTNVFIGECKFWRGESEVFPTINQLLSYLTWNDTKTAIILFVDNKDLSSVIEKLKTAISQHPNFLSMSAQNSETWLNYKFTMPGDPQRIIDMAIMIAHIPK